MKIMDFIRRKAYEWAMSNHITPAELHDLLTYDADTGQLFWKPRGDKVWDSQNAGKEALCYVGTKGYKRGTIRGKSYEAHRVIVAMVDGEWPKQLVDHEDRDKSNNRWSNLRHATKSQNLANSVVRGKLKSRGVYFDTKRGKFAAFISRRFLGRFETEIEAAQAYNAAASVEFGKFARLNEN